MCVHVCTHVRMQGASVLLLNYFTKEQAEFLFIILFFVIESHYVAQANLEFVVEPCQFENHFPPVFASQILGL